METCVISGKGIVTPIAIGTKDFSDALFQAKTNYSMMTTTHHEKEYSYPIASAHNFDLKSAYAQLPGVAPFNARMNTLRNLPAGSSLAVFCALEAWLEAELHNHSVDPMRVALISCGSNLQSEWFYKQHAKYDANLHFMNPNYGLSVFDTDVIGLISELLKIEGEGFTVGGASASSNLGIIQATRLVQSGLYDVVLVVAPMMELSLYEMQAFTVMGAMATADAGLDVASLCRPFDEKHRGFVYGQNAAALVLESEEHARKRGKFYSSYVSGHATKLDANRNPNPSVRGEAFVMNQAIKSAGLNPADIQYVNTHGTASPLGDRTEVEALIEAGLRGVTANSTKSLVGHGLSAAAMVEAIASIVQLEKGFVHPIANLSKPISDAIKWVNGHRIDQRMQHALSNSFGFGGINTSLVISTK